jgi:hypothetical protein
LINHGLGRCRFRVHAVLSPEARRTLALEPKRKSGIV